MDIFNTFQQKIGQIIDDLAHSSNLPIITAKKFSVDSPKEENHGDLATNAAMVYAKYFQLKPLELASLIKERLEKDSSISKVEVVSPGFVNIFLQITYLQRILKDVLLNKDNFAKNNKGKGQKINIEYVSANPTGPLHIGHGRGAVVGDVLANLYSFFGYKVTKEYYINDAGAQIDILAKSLYFRYLQLADKEQNFNVGEDFYPGEYLITIAQKIYAKDGTKWLNAKEEDWLAYMKAFALEEILITIKQDLHLIGVNQEIFSSEKSIATNQAYQVLLQHLEKKQLLYMGKLNPPKGKQIDDFEPRLQKLFKAQQFGDDTDRPLEKSNGERTYFANDMIYHFDKINRGYSQLINIWGADHIGYIKRMVSAVKALSDNKINLNIITCQMVNLMEDGTPIRMSKRAGKFVTLRDLVDFMGKDIFRFMMITRKNDVPLDFDLIKVKEQSISNPLFYIQYAYARICSVIRNAENENIIIDQDIIKQSDCSLLVDPAEINLIKSILKAPQALETALINNDPHKIYLLLLDITRAFHSLWNRGKENEELRFIMKNNQNLTIARLCLILMAATVIKIGMDILGVNIRESM